MPDGETTRQNRAVSTHSSRMQSLEYYRRDHLARIESLEKSRDAVAMRLAQGATDLALLRRDVRMLLWLAASLAAPVIGAIGAGIVWAIKGAAT